MRPRHSPPEGGRFVVVIGGGTASGKTTLALEVARRSGALLIAHDRYYFGAPDPASFNFDHPDALETDLLVEHLGALLAGRTVELPLYDFTTHRRSEATEHVEPAPLMVVEGILTLQDRALSQLADLRVFVDAPADLRLVRRLRRDVVERGRSTDSVLAQYMATVRPSHEVFVEPTKAEAHLVLRGTEPVGALAERLLGAVGEARQARAQVSLPG